MGHSDEGSRVNAAESPPTLAKFFASLFGKPAANALVIGGGSGADAVGFAAAGLNVTVIKKNDQQVRHMVARFNALTEKMEEIPDWVDILGAVKFKLQHQCPTASPTTSSSSSSGDVQAPASVPSPTKVPPAENLQMQSSQVTVSETQTLAPPTEEMPQDAATDVAVRRRKL